MDVGSIVTLLVTVAQVLKEIWEGPLGQMLRDLMDGKSVAAQVASDSNDEMKNIITCKMQEKVKMSDIAFGIYLFTVAKYLQPKKYKAACKIRKMVIKQREAQLASEGSS
jgi:hypothetical protein